MQSVYLFYSPRRLGIESERKKGERKKNRNKEMIVKEEGKTQKSSEYMSDENLDNNEKEGKTK